MMPQPQLLATTGYYIRQLIKQQGQELKSAVAHGTQLIADTTADINRIIASLYPNETETTQMMSELELLVKVQQHLRSQNSLYASTVEQLQDIEARIFRILGLSRVGYAH